jgi:hypothetical protein
VIDARRTSRAAPRLDRRVLGAPGWIPYICRTLLHEADQNRLGVRCSYSNANAKKVDLARRGAGTAIRPVFSSASDPSWTAFPLSAVDEQLSIQALELLKATSSNCGNIHALCDIYFTTFHKSFPIIDQDDFYAQLWLHAEWTTPHFSVLLCSMILISHLSSRTGATAEQPNEMYQALKGMHFVLQSTGQVSTELIQARIILASYEHCQALGQDAWLSIGTSARMGHILGLHRTIKFGTLEGLMEDRIETKRNIWWSIVILERYILAI